MSNIYYIKSFKRQKYKYIAFYETTSYSLGFYFKIDKKTKTIWLHLPLFKPKETKIDIKHYKEIILNLKINDPQNVVGIAINKANKLM